MTSPASGPNAVKPRMRSPSSSISAFRNPRVSESVWVRSTASIGSLARRYATPLIAGLPFAQPDTGQLRIGEQAERHLPPGRHAVPAGEVVQHHAEVVDADMREVRAAGAVAYRPDVLCRGLEPLVYLDVSPLVRLDPGFLQTDAVGVRGAPPGDQEVRPLELAAFRTQANGLSGSPLDAKDGGTGQDLDPLVPEESLDRLGHVRVFAMDQRAVPFDDGHAAAEAAEGLRQLEAHVAAAQDDQVFRQVVQIQCLDVSQRARIREPRGVIDPGTRPGVDHDGLAAERPESRPR